MTKNETRCDFALFYLYGLPAVWDDLDRHQRLALHDRVVAMACAGKFKSRAEMEDTIEDMLAVWVELGGPPQRARANSQRAVEHGTEQEPVSKDKEDVCHPHPA